MDKKIKTVLICDTLNLVGVCPYDRKALERESELANKRRLLGHEADPPVQLKSDSFLARVVKLMGEINEEETQMIIDFEEEQFRLGNFEKIFPCINNVKIYSQFFECQRQSNQVLLKYLA